MLNSTPSPPEVGGGANEQHWQPNVQAFSADGIVGPKLGKIPSRGIQRRDGQIVLSFVEGVKKGDAKSPGEGIEKIVRSDHQKEINR
jgi:hypothetical protein